MHQSEVSVDGSPSVVKLEHLDLSGLAEQEIYQGSRRGLESSLLMWRKVTRRESKIVNDIWNTQFGRCGSASDETAAWYSVVSMDILARAFRRSNPGFGLCHGHCGTGFDYTRARANFDARLRMGHLDFTLAAFATNPVIFGTA